VPAEIDHEMVGHAEQPGSVQQALAVDQETPQGVGEVIGMGRLHKSVKSLSNGGKSEKGQVIEQHVWSNGSVEEGHSPAVAGRRAFRPGFDAPEREIRQKEVKSFFRHGNL
jgi:hypothetical protein